MKDLSTINTNGFRGEALASISQVASLTVTTGTKDSDCAWRAKYVRGKLSADVEPTAGETGTRIEVIISSADIVRRL